MTQDHVDEVIAQWQRERPEVDVSGMEIIGRLARLGKAIGPLLDTTFSHHNLEAWEFDVLATLRRSGNPYQLSASQLFKSMMITSGTMTNRIDRLEKRGLTKRTKHPTDGRVVLVELTPTGMDKVDATLADHAINESAILESLNKRDQQQLARLLRKLLVSLE